LPESPLPASDYDDRSYYGRPALKAAPFEKWVVGGYIFLAGLSGASQLLSTLLDLTGSSDRDAAVSSGRRLSMLAPTLGSALLIYDLNTPQRFYNMLRIAKRTSPMSIGTWILMAFSAFSGATLGLDLLRRWLPRSRSAARLAQVPAAVAGAALCIYTASLLSATSTPLWAAAPKALAVRFGSSSIAAGAAALSLCERRAGRRRTARDLDTLMMLSLMVEHAAGRVWEQTFREKGVSAGVESRPLLAAATLGAAVPLGLHVLSALAGRRSERLQQLAALVTLAGSLCLRVGVLEAGGASANRPQDYFRLARPPKGSPETR
jgi:formate-dependent nitrite reductase membrane component NrfD